MKTISITSEEDLLQKLRGGDREAFKELYDLYHRRLTLKLVYLLKSEELAQDVLQDIFVKIWENRKTIDPTGNFGGLLYTMASNLAKNVFRKSIYDQLMRSEFAKNDSYSPFEALDNASNAKTILNTALDRLTPRQREVYCLHKIEGLSYREISKLLSISESAINHHIQSANKQLREILKTDRILIALLISCIGSF
ncbi:sigma-70 family RNA polymerase sigma factor [Sphingobacterium sp.]|uniref:RNA polymerase sigma factor n=1 Tax=Sphingobacterium sp. TaxID=341027 RepID=UPI0031DE2069